MPETALHGLEGQFQTAVGFAVDAPRCDDRSDKSLRAKGLRLTLSIHASPCDIARNATQLGHFHDAISLNLLI
jgi:hypothetical protein